MKKIFSLAFTVFGVFMICLFVYGCFLRIPHKASKVVDEIVTMKIDSCSSTSLTPTYIYYTFYVGGKYRVVIDRKLPKLYSSTGEDDVWITDITGHSVMMYHSGRHSWSWARDYVKLLKYLKVEPMRTL
jgi:hypothetical protein